MYHQTQMLCAGFVFAVFQSVRFWKHPGVFHNAVCGFTVCLPAVGIKLGMLVFAYLSLVLCLSLSLSSADSRESRPL